MQSTFALFKNDFIDQSLKIEWNEINFYSTIVPNGMQEHQNITKYHIVLYILSSHSSEYLWLIFRIHNIRHYVYRCLMFFFIIEFIQFSNRISAPKNMLFISFRTRSYFCFAVFVVLPGEISITTRNRKKKICRFVMFIIQCINSDRLII